MQSPNIHLDPTEFHINLAQHNVSRIAPSTPTKDWKLDEQHDLAFRFAEGEFLETLRKSVSYLMPVSWDDANEFVGWFESLEVWGPGQHHPLFDWIEDDATLDELKWFLTQEAAGEAGFDDLVAYTQIKLPPQAKLECARNYWDEMGRGKRGAMHGLLLERMVQKLDLQPAIKNTVWESLALGNAMLGMATTRRYTYHSLGALGVIELTAPARAAKVAAGMKRLQLEPRVRSYFDLHAVLDVEHSKAWIREIIFPLVKENFECARYIAEGALMRLQCGKLCFDRYSRELWLRKNFVQAEFSIPTYRENSYAQQQYY